MYGKGKGWIADRVEKEKSECPAVMQDRICERKLLSHGVGDDVQAFDRCGALPETRRGLVLGSLRFGREFCSEQSIELPKVTKNIIIPGRQYIERATKFTALASISSLRGDLQGGWYSKV